MYMYVQFIYLFYYLLRHIYTGWTLLAVRLFFMMLSVLKYTCYRIQNWNHVKWHCHDKTVDILKMEPKTKSSYRQPDFFMQKDCV